MSPENYQIVPVLRVISVTPENVTQPNYVDLEIEEMKDGENYTITIFNTLDPA
jgi:hypothetical protein